MNNPNGHPDLRDSEEGYHPTTTMLIQYSLNLCTRECYVYNLEQRVPAPSLPLAVQTTRITNDDAYARTPNITLQWRPYIAADLGYRS
jgi:hypothetical protein